MPITIEQIKETIRKPYAWPGGYRLLFAMEDGETLLPETAHDNFREIVTDTKTGSGEWCVVGLYIHWESDSPLYDAHTGEIIDSEYGPC